MGVDPCEHVLQIGIGLDTVQARRLDQAEEYRSGPPATWASGEEPVLARQGQFPFILPISGRKLKSIIDGIRCMGAASRFATSSSVVEAM
ncbi:hypothetical protein [Aromatoleum anaerobium]|uniref:hypothetical protein n=1 Tax=Aromatoleum anaerobium TaxID=182180 RepID=UPI003CCFF11E